MIRTNSRAAERFLQAARVPCTLAPQIFGGWTIRRDPLPGLRFLHRRWAHLGWSDYTVLFRTEPVLKEPDWDNIHRVRDDGKVEELDVVMEDSPRELSKHLPIWMAARGRILVTGLGLGCVARGLLASPAVEHIDVVEIDPEIIRVIGPEFTGNDRVTIHLADALQFEAAGRQWNFAWHDIWTPENKGLHEQHARLIGRFRSTSMPQGAWQFPRPFKRQLRRELIGGFLG